MVISAQCQGLKIKDLLYSIFLIHSSLSTSPLNHQETEWRFEEGEEADKRSKTTTYNYLFCVAPCKLWLDIHLYRIIKMLFQIKKLSYCELLEKNKSSPRSYSFPVSSAHFMQVAEVHSCPFTCLFFFLCLVKLFPNQWPVTKVTKEFSRMNPFKPKGFPQLPDAGMATVRISI